MPEVGEVHVDLVVPAYANKLQEITAAYKRYCAGIKRADCVLANKTKNQEFARFLQTPAVPRRRPDITVFIHKPLEHFREILKLLNVILSNTPTSQEDYPVICQVVHEMQVRVFRAPLRFGLKWSRRFQLTYREITVGSGLMEPTGEGRPLLSVQDLESRLVFTKCKVSIAFFIAASPVR